MKPEKPKLSDWDKMVRIRGSFIGGMIVGGAIGGAIANMSLLGVGIGVITGATLGLVISIWDCKEAK